MKWNVPSASAPASAATEPQFLRGASQALMALLSGTRSTLRSVRASELDEQIQRAEGRQHQDRHAEGLLREARQHPPPQEDPHDDRRRRDQVNQQRLPRE